MPTNSDQLDLALEARDAAISSAVDHADRVSEDWSTKALGCFELYAMGHSYFQTIAVRTHAKVLGLEDPPDTRAWGWVAKEAARRGWVMADHYAKQPSKTSHARPAVVWRSVIFNRWTD